MLKLKLQYFGHLMQRTDSLEKTLTLGKIEGRGEGDDRGWDDWIASLIQWTWVWVSPRVGDGQGGLACCSPWGREESDMTERLSWIDTSQNRTQLPFLTDSMLVLLVDYSNPYSSLYHTASELLHGLCFVIVVRKFINIDYFSINARIALTSFNGNSEQASFFECWNKNGSGMYYI